MKKVMKKFNRALSIMLVAAMVLTMAPQTAMPVLAAELEVEEQAAEVPADVTVTEDEESADEPVVEETVEAPENGETEEVVAPSDDENADTEGDDIANEDPAVEEPVEEEPSEEEVVDPTTTEEEEDLTNTVSAVEIMADNVPAPTITVKRGSGETEKALKSGDKVPFGTGDIKFTLTGAAGNELYFVQGKTPVTSAEAVETANNKYSDAVNVTAPTETAETKITIQAIQVKPAVAADPENNIEAAEKVLSSIATFEIVFEAKVNRIKADSSVTNVEVKVGTSASAITNVLDADGYALDKTKDLYLTAAVTEDDAATMEVDKVLYATQEKVTDGFVWIGEDGKLSADVTEVTPSNGKYKISKDALGEDLVLNVTKKTMPKIQFALAEGTRNTMFTVTAKKGTQAIADWTNRDLTGAADDVIYAPTGTAINVTITPKASCALGGVKYKSAAENAEEKNGTKSGTTYKVSLGTTADPFNADYTITVTATESYKGAIVKEGDEVLKETKAKTWTVDPRKTYTISAEQGGGTVYEIGDAKIVPAVEGATITPVTEKEEVNGSEVDKNTGKWTLTLNAEADGKQPVNGQPVIVELYDSEGKEKIDTITINVRPVITKVTVTGLKNGAINQIIGTEKTYPIKLETKEATSTDTLVAGSLAGAETDYIETAVIEKDANGKPVLKVVTKTAAVQDKAATIKIYNDSDKTANKEPVATVDVKTIEPTWTAKAPTVKLASASDIALKLNMTLPQGADVLAANADTEYYYKVTPKALGSVSENDTLNEKDVYVKASTTSATTTEVIQVIGEKFGKGWSAKFDVTVTLGLYTKLAENVKVEEATPIVSSMPATLKNAATKAPYYADKITLKKEKAASGIYTGQSTAVATIDFGKNTTYNRDEDVQAYIVGDEKQETFTAEIENGKVILSVDEDADPGKYTLRVEQVVDMGIPAGVVPASATLPITVVQGIYEIYAESVPTIYVTDKKAGTAKITTTYNPEGTKPKTAKVSYAVGTMNSGEFTEATSGKIAEFVSVKNGTVTVKKGYQLDTITDNTFVVQVKAADYEGNASEPCYVPFEITTTAQELGDVVLATYNIEAKTYTKVSTAEKIPANEITGGKAEIVVLRKGVTKADNLDPNNDLVDSDLYTLSFNKKDVGLDENGEIFVKKPVDKVKVSAVTTDGSKNKATALEFSVTYETVEGVKLVFSNSSVGTFGEDKSATVTVPTGEVISLKAVDKDNTALDDRKVVNYKIVAGTGAKIVSGKDTLSVGIQMTAETATVKLTEQKGKNPTEYKIINKNFGKNAAPKVSLAKGKKIYAGYKTALPVTFTIAKGAVEGAKKIKISAASDDNSQYLLGQISNKEITLSEGTTLTKDAPTDIIVNFNANLNVIKKATLYFDFIGVATDAENNTTEVILTKTSAGVNVKTELLKKSYTFTNKYTMAAKDTAKVTLDGKKTGVKNVTFNEILNANIKGTPNKFTEAFALDSSTGVLSLTNEAKAKKDYQETDGGAKMNNLIGFVKYTVTYEDGSSIVETKQINITIKPSVKKLTATKATVLAELNISTTTTVMAGKSAVELAVVEYVPDSTKGDGKIKAANVAANNKGNVTLFYDGTPKPGTYKGTLYVVPDDSLYAASAKTAYAKTKEDGNTDTTWDTYKKDGIAIAVSVDFIVKAADTKNKVKVNDTKPSFKDKTAETVGDKEVYKLEVTYTPVLTATVATIEADRSLKNSKPLTPAWVSFEKVADANKMLISIDKAAYASYVKAGKTTTSKGESYPLNGKAVDATAVFTYSAEGAVADSVKIKITPPTLEATDIVAAVVEKVIKVTVDPEEVELEKGGAQVFTAEVTVDGTKVTDPTVAWTVATKVEGGTLSTGTKFGEGNEANKLTIGSDEAQALTVTATYTDGAKDYTGTATVTIKADA